MTDTFTDEVDDTAPNPATSDPTPPITTVPDPTSSAFWTSPSSYITLSTVILPIITMIWHKDTSAAAKAIAEAAPLLAAVALLVMRGLHKRAVIAANATVQTEKVRAAADAAAHRRQLSHEKQLRALEMASPAEKKQFVAAHLAA